MSELNQIKEKIQTEALWAWVKNNYKGTVLLPTGSGKTKIIVRAAGGHIRKNPGEKWLVVVPQENLRDYEIPKEFKEWGYKKEYELGVTTECIHTAFRRKGEQWDGLAIDEVHLTLSDNYRSLLENNSFNKIICLTAELEDNVKRLYLQTKAPIVYKKDLNEALEQGLISNFTIYNLALDFTEQERAAYDKIQLLCKHYEALLVPEVEVPIDKKSSTAYRRAQNYVKSPRSSYELRSIASGYIRTINNRADIFLNAESKVSATKLLFEKHIDRYTIFFSETIKLAERVHKVIGERSVIYHSRMSKSEKSESLRLYRDGRTKKTFITSAKALNAGFDLKRCKLGICGSGNSKRLTAIQRLGRNLRLYRGESAIFVNLYIRYSHEVNLVKRRLYKINPNNIKWVDSIEEVV
jgi:superfamily II DNA or RNA helicase